MRYLLDTLNSVPLTIVFTLGYMLCIDLWDLLVGHECAVGKGRLKRGFSSREYSGWRQLQSTTAAGLIDEKESNAGKEGGLREGGLCVAMPFTFASKVAFFRGC